MPKKVPGLWIICCTQAIPVVGPRALYGWGIEEPAVLFRASASQAERLGVTYDIRPARVGYYGDEEMGIWLTEDGAMIEGSPVALGEQYG